MKMAYPSLYLGHRPHRKIGAVWPAYRLVGRIGSISMFGGCEGQNYGHVGRNTNRSRVGTNADEAESPFEFAY